MERPNNVPQYDDVDLKLGIKSSLPNVKETLALFLLMWRSCGKASVLDYCGMRMGADIVKQQLESGAYFAR